ncbi:MAG: hypothetical protein P1U42_10220 [Phycisphaerales bacterium]|nr:hypothetical protein [Phycisphaerales bacterium]
MFNIPAIPPFEGLHPFIVHFAVGILLIAWVPMVIGLLDSKRRISWFRSGLMLILLGTMFTFGAVLTGEATEEVVPHSSQLVEDAIHEHEELAELSRNLFVGVSVIYLTSMVMFFKAPQKKRKMIGIVGSVFVGLSYILGALALANAGHLGGLLVHEHGLHAPVTASDMSQKSNDDTMTNEVDD